MICVCCLVSERCRRNLHETKRDRIGTAFVSEDMYVLLSSVSTSCPQLLTSARRKPLQASGVLKKYIMSSDQNFTQSQGRRMQQSFVSVSFKISSVSVCNSSFDKTNVCDTPTSSPYFVVVVAPSNEWMHQVHRPPINSCLRIYCGE